MFRKTLVILLALAFGLAATALAIDRSKVIPEEGGQTIIVQPSDVLTHPYDSINYACAHTASYPVPDGAGDSYEGMRFTAVNNGNLIRVWVLLRNSSASVLDTIGDLQVRVWGNDASNPAFAPGVPDSTNILATVVVPNATLLAGGWPQNTNKSFPVNVGSIPVLAGQVFHVTIGKTADHFNQATGFFFLRIDNCAPAACNTDRWIEYGPEGPDCVGAHGGGTGFHEVDACFIGNPCNFQIAAIIQTGSVNAPALTTYGLVGLTVLLLATGVWMFRKKTAPVNAPNLG